MEQLKENIDSVNIDITESMEEDINQIHSSQPNPAP
jgi:aryl-alcohol dehydrogenase-like predicted oxidoreductase